MLDDEKGNRRIGQQADKVAGPGARERERDGERDRASAREEPQFAFGQPRPLDPSALGEGERREGRDERSPSADMGKLYAALNQAIDKRR